MSSWIEGTPVILMPGVTPGPVAERWVEGSYALVIPHAHAAERPRLDVRVGFPALGASSGSGPMVAQGTQPSPLGGTRGARVRITFTPTDGTAPFAWECDPRQDGRLDDGALDLTDWAGKAGTLTVRAETTGTANAAVVFPTLRIVRR